MKLLSVFLMILTAAYLCAADIEYNTGGSTGFVPDLSGSTSGWGEWFLTSYTNDTPDRIQIVEFGFPCCGNPTADFGWVVWTDMSDTGPPSGNPQTADFHGSFTPAEGPGGNPAVYTFVDMTMVETIITIESDETIVFGYQNTGYGGQTPFNGTETWAWRSNNWEADESHYRTAVLEMKADIWTALQQSTWGEIKSLF